MYSYGRYIFNGCCNYNELEPLKRFASLCKVQTGTWGVTGESSATADGARFLTIDAYLAPSLLAAAQLHSWSIIGHDYEWAEPESVLLFALFLQLELTLWHLLLFKRLCGPLWMIVRPWSFLEDVRHYVEQGGSEGHQRGSSPTKI